ncbi:PEP/pyruvate-binding domain-containing protein [bacterium]|nr:PEP/pyruvate-binding domain-containing protein [bacterium]MBU1064446.1 PEP/pyruvate-binding domain-containing protein [bacterium]MBU1635032.1 PEP/pyruvate-binding domain-containing protein [bacterium]MBU1872349.1 PEP/pyruvate-binding domain-containing protein [bacterium]
MTKVNEPHNIPKYNRELLGSKDSITCIGKGQFGGKANGLVFIQNVILEKFKHDDFTDIHISVPKMIVLCTDVFDEFMAANNLYEIALSDSADTRIAHAFQKANLPSEMVGDLWSMIANVHIPLAIRSSSMLEDAIYEPFAGIYATKMIANNQLETVTRFNKLVEAVKFVYASTYFRKAKNYFKAVNRSISEEKMAVIVQEVVGHRHGNRYYPNISGVARSYNYYPLGHASPDEGVAELALGLGRTIVDEGISWNYSPAYPHANPPFNSVNDLMKNSQNSYWAVNMGSIADYDPVKETEYLVKCNLAEAEKDGVLNLLASSYDYHSDRLYSGTFGNFPRVLTFAPVLQMNELPLNDVVKSLLQLSQQEVGTSVEMEFALSINPANNVRASLGFLQVRPMVVSADEVDITQSEMTGDDVLLASETVMGNGICTTISNIVYVKPDRFRKESARDIVKELEQINLDLRTDGKRYLLIGFGRWGSRDPWLGIPVEWGQISSAKVIVESTLPEINVDLSQGTHFFHNINSFQVSYFSVHHSGKYKIDWDWLNQQPILSDQQFVRHIQLASPIRVKVDGRSSKGVIQK